MKKSTTCKRNYCFWPLLFAIISCSSSEQQNQLLKVESFPESINYVGIAIADDDYFIWGSSPVVDPAGKVHLFSARWPKETEGKGWISHCEIAHYIGDAPEGPFHFAEVVVKGEAGQLSPHNPTIRKFGDTYALVYIANEGVQTMPGSQKIYMRCANSLEGPWNKAGINGLVLDKPKDRSIWCYGSRVGVNNPSIIQNPAGDFMIYYKASPKDGGERRFGVAVAKELEGPYSHYKYSVTPKFEEMKTIEDGYAFHFGDKYYILSRTKTEHPVIKGYDGILWESTDGFNFKENPGYFPAKYYLPDEQKDKLRTIWRGGQLERPQLLLIDGIPSYLFTAAGLSLNQSNNSACYIFKIQQTGLISR